MADNKNENLNQDYSNAVMSHTSEGIPASDFIRSNNDIEKEPEIQRESKNFWQDAWSQLKRNKLAVVGMIGLIIIIILALIGPLFSAHDYAEQDVERRNL
ncbi:ABC transporter permease, partial [Staphylococcus cohnii]